MSMDTFSSDVNQSLQDSKDVTTWLSPYGMNQTTNNIAHKCLIIENDTRIPWNHPENILSWQSEELAYKIMCGIFMPLFFLLGVPANILNMIVFYRQSLKERINVCLFILALVDLLYLVPVFLYQSELLNSWFTNVVRNGVIYQYMMNNNLLGFYGFRFGSMLLAAVISTERCVCVMFPLTAQRCVPTKIFAIVIVFFVCLQTIMRFTFVPEIQSACFYEVRTERTSWQYVVIGQALSKSHVLIAIVECLFIGFCFAIGCPALVLITTVITAIKLRQIVRWRSHTSSAMSSPKEIAVTKMLLCLSTEFLVLTTPDTLLQLRRLFPSFLNPSYHINLYRVLTNCRELSFYLNSTVNFVVYYNTGTKFRETLHALLGIKKVDKKTDHSKETTSSGAE